MSTKLGDSFVNEQEVNFLTRDSWQNWTPTVTQGVAVGITVDYARYVVLANTVIVQARLAITSAGTAGNAIVIGGIPAAVAPVRGGTFLDVIGTMIVQDTGTAYYHGGLVSSGVTNWVAMAHNGAQIGVAPNFALANGDYIGIQATYER